MIRSKSFYFEAIPRHVLSSEYDIVLKNYYELCSIEVGNISFTFMMISKKIIWGLCAGSALLVSIILISVSLHKIGSTEYGVEYDVWSKKLDDAAKTGGLHNGPPGFKFIRFPSTQISEDLEDTCVSRDGLRVQFQISYQFLMLEEWILNVIVKYRDFGRWSKIVETAAYSAVQHSCSEFNITNFQNKRNLIQSRMLENVRIKLEGSENGTFTEKGVYAQAVSLQLRNVYLPEEYKNAVAEKQSAEEDIALAQNQRNQEITKANTMLFTAEKEAEKIMNKAMNDVNVTLTLADLKAEETTYAFARETEIIKQAKLNFKLDTNGVLSYIANQLYAKAPNLMASIREPAQISVKDEL